MRYFALSIILLLFNGCIYFNDTGVSTKYYSKCKEYYDSNGDYVKECPTNLINYSDFDK